MTPEAFGVRPVVHFGSSWSPPWPPKAHQKDAKISPKSAFQPEGPHGVSQRAQKSKMNPKNVQHVELLGPCGVPLGAFGHPYFAFGVLQGILWDLWESFWIPWGTCWKHFGILWHPFGSFLGTLGVYRVCPKGGGAPLGRPDCGSLVILWGFLGTLWEPFVGTLGDTQTDRHIDIQTGPDQRLDQTRDQTRPEARPEAIQET